MSFSVRRKSRSLRSPSGSLSPRGLLGIVERAERGGVTNEERDKRERGKWPTTPQQDARRVVGAFRDVPSLRMEEFGWPGELPIPNTYIANVYGPRFRNYWVARFGLGEDAPPRPLRPVARQSNARQDGATGCDEKFFIVAPDIPDVPALIGAMKELMLATQGQRDNATAIHIHSPYSLWYFINRDDAWRYGIIPITKEQYNSSGHPLVDAGRANNWLDQPE